MHLCIGGIGVIFLKPGKFSLTTRSLTKPMLKLKWQKFTEIGCKFLTNDPTLNPTELGKYLIVGCNVIYVCLLYIYITHFYLS